MNLKELISVTAKLIRTSKGDPTIAVIIKTSAGSVEASAPQGTSKGKYEVRNFSVRGVNFSIEFINALGKKLKQMNIDLDTLDDLKKIENLIKEIDSTDDWHIIGGNALYALEAALLKAAAKFHGYELWQFILGKRKKIIPSPLGNAIGGGLHLEKEKKTDYQEFLLIPRTKHFFDAYFINLQAYKEVKKLIIKYDKEWQGILTAENAIASTLTNSQVLDILDELKKIIKEKFDIRIDIGIDMAATSLWDGKGYIYKNFPLRNVMRREEQVNYVFNLIKKYKLSYVEDPFYEDDFLSFSKLLSKLKREKIKCLICGDDLTTTNPQRIKKAIKEKAINAVIIKPNQVGSLITMRDSIELAQANNIIPIISHRSGETFDDTIAHLAVGFQIPFIKTGIIGKERDVKLKELERIEKKNGSSP